MYFFGKCTRIRSFAPFVIPHLFGNNHYFSVFFADFIFKIILQSFSLRDQMNRNKGAVALLIFPDFLICFLEHNSVHGTQFLLFWPLCFSPFMICAESTYYNILFLFIPS